MMMMMTQAEIAVTSNFSSHCKWSVMFRCCGMFFSIRHFIHFNSSVNRLIIYKIKVFLYILYIYVCAVYI